MDACAIDVTLEFLSVAFHSIMYYTSVYPKSVFVTRKKYDVVVYQCMYPPVNEYVKNWLKLFEVALKARSLLRVEFLISDIDEKSVLNFVFKFERILDYDPTTDADTYLVNCEQNLRAYCLQLASASSKFKAVLAFNFCITMFTNEATQMSMLLMPDLVVELPVVEALDDTDMPMNIVPLRRFPLRNIILDTFIEFPEI